MAGYATFIYNLKPKTKKSPLKHDTRILLLALLSGLPAVLSVLCLLWFGEYSPKIQWTLLVIVVSFWLGGAISLREHFIRPLQTILNLLSALHQEDYSIRARGELSDDALGELFIEVNSLSQTLRNQKLGALEAAALLRTVISEIEVAVFAFDNENKLRLANRAGEILLAQPIERLTGKNANELGLNDYLQGDATQIHSSNFPGGNGRYSIKHRQFRQGGIVHHLLVISDMSQALREEEKMAWQRIVRVLGHELNNSLTPIKSIAGSLASLFAKSPRPDDWESDVEGGLDVISKRAESLNRFMGSYAQLARLPQPKLQSVNVSALLHRVVALETRIHVTLISGPEISIQADGDQLEQLLINLIRNAVDAVTEIGHDQVTVSWTKKSMLEITVEDNGLGLSGTANLFVPFFTTKPKGSGIGLALSRQIAEAHGGKLTLENKISASGCIARLQLPIS